jgi:chemotaxis protein methyltransferase CheR
VQRRVSAVAARRSADLPRLCTLALGSREVVNELVEALCVGVTAMFRDPEFFSAYRRALPLLAGCGPIRGWHAGCATGEEVWSHLVILEEEGLGSHVRLYGTDVSEAALGRARRGLLPLDRMREYTGSYLRAGGRREFSRYYAAGADAAIVAGALRAGAVFGRHDLASDPPLGRFDVVFCRNVVMYFEPSLQVHVHLLLAASVRPGGILALGRGEALPRAALGAWDEVDDRHRIYRRRGDAALDGG